MSTSLPASLAWGEPTLAVVGRGERCQLAVTPGVTRGLASDEHRSHPGRLLLVEKAAPRQGPPRPAAPPRPASPAWPRCLVADFPTMLLTSGRGAVRAARGRLISGAGGVGALLCDMLTRLDREGCQLRQVDRPGLGSMVVDLADRVIDAEMVSQADGCAAAPMLAQIKVFIAANLHDPRLTPAAIASAHHISLRHLHRLFHQDERGVAEHLRHSRLERCRRDLEDPRLSRAPVRAIGARWGFPRAPEFSRRFQAAYGLPPGRYRASLNRGG